ncbi:MAG: fructoselysine 3-epimerase [Blautia sp.]|nr:fructoselysine 3-epimerase [Blautia sp.]
MKLGLFTCGYQRTTIEKAFADAKAFGYDYIELWGGRPHAYAPDLCRTGSEELRLIRELTDAYAMPVRIYTPEHNAYPFNYMLGTERQWEESMRYLTQALEAAALLSAPYMLISVGHGGEKPSEERGERLVRSLRRLSEEAKNAGRVLLLETLTKYESNTCTTLAELTEVLDEVHSPYLAGMCDVVAPFTCGEDPAEYARLLGKRLLHLHVVDSDGKSDTHLIPGEGIMPLADILQRMKAYGYNGSATIELVTNYIDRPTEAAEEAIRRLTSMLPE